MKPSCVQCERARVPQVGTYVQPAEVHVWPSGEDAVGACSSLWKMMNRLAKVKRNGFVYKLRTSSQLIVVPDYL